MVSLQRYLVGPVAVCALAACQKTPSSRDSGELTPPTAWVWTGEEASGIVDTSTVETVLQSVIERLRDVQGKAVIESYAAARTLGDPECPVEITSDNGIYGSTVFWDQYCVTLSQIGFNGPMTLWTFSQAPLTDGSDVVLGRYVADDYELDWAGSAIQGQTDIFNDDGSVHFSCPCTALQASGTRADGLLGWTVLVDGPAAWTGPEADDTWMRWGWVIDNLHLLWTQAGQENTLDAQGSFSDLHERYDTASIQLHVTGTPSDQISCSDHSATVMVHDSKTGQWYEALLESSEANDCSVCGPLGDAGEICLDISTLIDWEETPW